MRQARQPTSETLADRFIKTQHEIPMRDGVKLFTTVYRPRSTSERSPILLIRTPYSVRPYEPDKFPTKLGPSKFLIDAGYIFAYQDVRGCYMSEGDFVNMRPHISDKTGATQIDESTDTHDTIDWLLRNVPDNNGRVGMWGISYPGFYAAAGMIDAHPALKAVSPQAPIADWFFDDFHHHGAVFLPHSFNFLVSFGKPRTGPNQDKWKRFDHGTPDGYQFFMDIGPIANAEKRYLHGDVPFWTEVAQHPNYDEFWQARAILPHLNNVAPAVMTVGGWFDAEDLYGPLNIYRSVEMRNPDVFNMLVMGPWRHGGWAREPGTRLGNIYFGEGISGFYRENIEKKFFDHFLKNKGNFDLPEAYMFETGKNRWRTFDHWPPKDLEEKSLYTSTGMTLTFDAPTATEVVFDEYVSDPAKPVPFTETIVPKMTREYMTDDQRFAARRPDVLAYATDELTDDITLAGPIVADLWVSTSGTASDWIVKIIDFFPRNEPDPTAITVTRPHGGYQMMVRSEVIRGRFRNSYENPQPFTPGEPTRVRLELQDVLHTFKAGHRIMVQIQSSWFPLVDRNPQKYVDNIFEAVESDFQKATQRVYRSGEYPTRIVVGVLSDP